MLTSKERADLRAQANTLETTLIVGKSGVTDAVLEEVENLLNALKKHFSIACQCPSLVLLNITTL